MGIHLLQVEGSKELVTQAQYTKDNLNGKISFKDGSLVVSVPLQTVKDDLIATPTDNYSLVVKKYVDQQISSVNTNVNAIPAVTASATQTTGTTIGTVTIGQDTTTYKVDLSHLAPLASPALTGAPTAPTQAASTDDTTIATTAFVNTAVKNFADDVVAGLSAALDSDLLDTAAATSFAAVISDQLDEKQDKHAALTSISGLTTSANQMIYTTAKDTYATTPLTPFARTVLDDDDAATFRTTVDVFSKAEVRTEISNLVNSAPQTLDTLKELADALGNDPDFATTMSTELGNKQPLNAALTSISGLSTAANKMIYTTAKDTYAVTSVTDHGRSLINTADAAATRSLISVPSTTGEGASGTWNITAVNATTAATTTGNAGTATTLKTPRTISISDNSGTNTATGTSFNGSEDITLKMPATIKGALDGNAATTTKLKDAVTVNIADAGGTNTGLATSFDGSKNVIIKLPATIAANLKGTADYATADAKGNVIDTTYETKANAVTGLSVSGQTVTYTKGDGTTGTITTQDTNTLMTQNVSAADYTYPVLAVATPNATADLGAKTAIFSKDIKVNPKTGVVFANTFSGDLEGTADQAIADADGNDISDTYETKVNAITGLSVNGRVITYTKGDGNTGTITTQDTGDTHWTTKLIAGGATDTDNAATANGNTNLRLFDDNTARSTIKLTGAGATTVTSDATGTITVTSNNNAVNQTNSTTNANYAILLKRDNTTTTAIDGTFFNTGVYVNPSTKTVTATTFNGRATDAAQADNVTGTVEISHGGTGLTSSPSMLVDLESTAADNVLKASPRPGITGVLPVANGGTGQTDLSQVTVGRANTIFLNSTNDTNKMTLVYGAAGLHNGSLIVDTAEDTAGCLALETGSNGTEAIYVRQNDTSTNTKTVATLLDADHNTTFPGTVTAPTFSGYLAGTAEQANKDSAGNNIVSTYETKANAITSLGISGHTLTYGRGDNTSATLTLPSTDTTHWTSRLYVGAENSSVQAATTNGNTFITVTDDNTARNSVKIIGSGSTSVTSNNANVITVSSTDQKMTQTNSTANASYAILLKKNNTTTAETADAYFSTNVYVNPSTKTITATTFSGNATSATKATQDGDGKTISSTYAKLAGAAFTGAVTAPTADAGTNTTQVATTAFVKTAVDTAVTNLLGSAPEALDTLNELATALGNDPDFATTITTAIAGKQPLHAALTSISGLSTAANKMIYTTAANTYAVTTLTATARSLLDDADVATMRTTLSVPARDGTGASGTWAINISGNATTATKAIQDADGKVIADTYETKANAITNITADGRTVTFHKGDGTTGTFTTQDTDTDTHWTSKLILGSTTSTANESTTNGNTALRLFDNSTARNTITVKGTGATSVTSDAAGVMSVSSTDQKVAQNISTTNNTYPVLISGTANATANVDAAAVQFASGVKINPSTNTISATTFSGAIAGTTGTFSGTLTLTKTQDLSGTANSGPALIIGGTATTAHIEIDPNEIHAKATGTTVAPLYLNNEGGQVNIGTGGLKVNGDIDASGKTVTATTFSGKATSAGTADSATKATQDGSGNTITSTYATKAQAVTGFSVDGTTVTFTRADGTTGTFVTQDTNTDTNTHYTTHLYAGTSTGVANASTSNGATYLILADDSTARNRVKLTGSGATTVTSDASGNITISSTDTNTNTDTLVTQNVSTANATYPILATPTADANANQGAKTSIFASGVKINPSTSSVIATNFTGLASKATADASGNVITNTYATKAQAVTGFSVNGTTVTFTRADGTTGTFVTQDTNTDTDTHYTTHLYAGTSSGVANATTTNGNTYLILADNSTARNRVKLVGSGGTTVTSDASGNITISSTGGTSADTLMTQTVSTTNNTYPILATATANATATATTTAVFASGVKLNPSTGTISATAFTGNLTGNVTGNVSGTAANVTGTVAVTNGGTGITSNPSMLTNLGSTTAASVFATSPRPGVTGTLGVGNGGTGQTSLADVTGIGSALRVDRGTLAGTAADNLLYVKMADNDYFRIRVGATASNAGWVELATADDGNEPIYVRQYSGSNFATITRTVTLLDASGNTSFPGTVTATSFSGKATSAGTADSATKATQDGSGNVITSTYLPVAGGTITGNLRLKGSGNYGNKLNFGDGDYVYLTEATDDILTIQAKNIVFNTSGSNSTFNQAVYGPTAAAGTNNTQLATTAFVQNAVSSAAGTASSATTLATERTIDGVNFNGSAAVSHYGTCSTAAGTAAKTVALSNYVLVTGALVTVKFTVTNTAANPTLNVNSTGAKAIYYRGSAVPAAALQANATYVLVYDGTNYDITGSLVWGS